MEPVDPLSDLPKIDNQAMRGVRELVEALEKDGLSPPPHQIPLVVSPFQDFTSWVSPVATRVYGERVKHIVVQYDKCLFLCRERLLVGVLAPCSHIELVTMDPLLRRFCVFLFPLPTRSFVKYQWWRRLLRMKPYTTSAGTVRTTSRVGQIAGCTTSGATMTWTVRGVRPTPWSGRLVTSSS